jgi:hypothetical protein
VVNCQGIGAGTKDEREVNMDIYCWKTNEMKNLLTMIDHMTEQGASMLAIQNIKILRRKLHNFRGNKLSWSKIVNKVLGER